MLNNYTVQTRYNQLFQDILNTVQNDTQSRYKKTRRKKNGRIDLDTDYFDRDKAVVERYHDLLGSNKYRIERLYRNSEAAVRYVWTREDFIRFKEAFRRFGYAPTANRQIAEYVGKGMHPNHIQYFKRALKQRLGGSLIRDLIESRAYDELISAAPIDDGRGLADYLPSAEENSSVDAGTKMLFGSTVGGSFFKSHAPQTKELDHANPATGNTSSSTQTSSVILASSSSSVSGLNASGSNLAAPSKRGRGRPPKTRLPQVPVTETVTETSSTSKTDKAINLATNKNVGDATNGGPTGMNFSSTPMSSSRSLPEATATSSSSLNQATHWSHITSADIQELIEEGEMTKRGNQHVAASYAPSLPRSEPSTQNYGLEGQRGTSGKRPHTELAGEGEYIAKRRMLNAESHDRAIPTPYSVPTIDQRSSSNLSQRNDSWISWNNATGTTSNFNQTPPSATAPSRTFLPAPNIVQQTSINPVPMSESTQENIQQKGESEETLTVLARLMQQTAELQAMVHKLSSKQGEQPSQHQANPLTQATTMERQNHHPQSYTSPAHIPNPSISHQYPMQHGSRPLGYNVSSSQAQNNGNSGSDPHLPPNASPPSVVPHQHQQQQQAQYLPPYYHQQFSSMPMNQPPYQSSPRNATPFSWFSHPADSIPKQPSNHLGSQFQQNGRDNSNFLHPAQQQQQQGGTSSIAQQPSHHVQYQHAYHSSQIQQNSPPKWRNGTIYFSRTSCPTSFLPQRYIIIIFNTKQHTIFHRISRRWKNILSANWTI
jgi:hypothetical protein